MAKPTIGFFLSIPSEKLTLLSNTNDTWETFKAKVSLCCPLFLNQKNRNNEVSKIEGDRKKTESPGQNERNPELTMIGCGIFANEIDRKLSPL